MQRVLIVEGPDRCGKTNIAQELSRVLDIPYFKVSSEKKNWNTKDGFRHALEYDQTYISEFLEQTGHSCIIDRAYPSEWVYSRVYGRETNHEVLRQVDERFSRMGAVVLLCTRREVPHEWDDELVDKSAFNVIRAKYRDFSLWTTCSTININVDDYHCNLETQVPDIAREFVKCLQKDEYTVKRTVHL